MSGEGSRHIVDADREGQRIDNFLFTRLKGVPKGLIYRLLRTGKIRVNGKRVKQTYRLQEEDEVKIPKIRTSDQVAPAIGDFLKQQILSAIIYEDENIMVINKPAGLAVHPGSNVSYGLIEVLRAAREKAAYLELVHRLDRDTSGCLLIAKNKHSLNALHDLLRDPDTASNKFEKTYHLLVKGEWDLGKISVDTPLQTKGTVSDERQEDKNRWKDALTIFHPLELFQGFTLMNAQIKTGRTHQIRLHVAETGFPIVGDNKHGDFAFNRECKKKGFKRMFLHAAEVAFELPENGQKITINAPMGNELMGFLKSLDQRKGL